MAYNIFIPTHIENVIKLTTIAMPTTIAAFRRFKFQNCTEMKNERMKSMRERNEMKNHVKINNNHNVNEGKMKRTKKKNSKCM